VLSAPREQAFTLIEVMVAMVLMLVVVTLVGRQVVDGSDYFRRSQQNREVASTSADVLAQLERDLVAAGSPDRIALAGAELSTAVRGAVTMAHPGPDVRDIVEARPYAITIRTRALSERASDGSLQRVQCVRWAVDPSGWLIRTVRSALVSGSGVGWRTTAATPSGCSGSIVSTERLLPVPMSGGAQPNVFAFTELRSNGAGGDAASCQTVRRPRGSTYAPAQGVAAPAANPGGQAVPWGGGVVAPPLNAIVGIAIDLRGTWDPDSPPTVNGQVIPQAAFRSVQLRSSVTLRSRTTRMYQQALGCIGDDAEAGVA